MPVLHGLWTYHIVRAQHTSALALGEQVLQLGAATNDDGLLLQGNMEVGWSHFFLGELEQAREHLERVLALYDHERHSSHAFTYGDNPATSARSNLAQVLWLLGHPDQVAAATARRTWRSCGRWSSTPTASPLDSTVAAVPAPVSGAMPPATRALVDEALVLSEAHGLAFIGAMASILKGWVLTREGDLARELPRCATGWPPSSPPAPSWPGRTGCA